MRKVSLVILFLMFLFVSDTRGLLASTLYIIEAILGKKIEDGKKYEPFFIGIAVWGVLMSLFALSLGEILAFLDLVVWAITLYSWKDLLEAK